MLLAEPSIKVKLKFIPRPTEQCCRAHLAPAPYLCSKPACQLYTFLCERCRRDNLHGHVDDIHEYIGWVERMSERVRKLRVTGQQRIFESVRGEASKSVRRYVGELRRVLEVVEGLESQVCELIRESKAKIVGYIRKYEGFGQSKLASRGHLYANPYLLAGKLNSERNDDFVQELKQCLRGQAQLVDGFNPKYQVITLQNRLKQVIDGNSADLFTANKEIIKVPTVQPQQQSIIIGSSKPEKVFIKEDRLISVHRNLTQIWDLKEGTMGESMAVMISRCSSVDEDFIGIRTDNNKQLITYIGGHPGSFVFDFRICSMLLYRIGSKHYAFLGKQNGTINAFDISANKIDARPQTSHTQKVQYLKACDLGKKSVLSCGKKSSISLYNIGYVKDEVEFYFQDQIDLNLSGNQEITQFQTYGNVFVAFIQGRGVLVFDLILKVPKVLLNTNTGPQKICDFISLIDDSENHLIVANHNEGQSCIWLWTVDWQKSDSIKNERLVFFEKQEIFIMDMSGKSVALLRSGDIDRKIYLYNLAVM